MINIKFGIQLPEWYEKRLKLWAALKGTSRATLAANILQARIEANDEWIDKQLEAIAQDKGITPEELKKELLNEGEDDEV